MSKVIQAEIQVESEDRAGNVLLHIKGELGLPPTTDNFESALNRFCAKRPQVLVLDLAGLTFISSLGIGILVGARRGVARWGGHLRLAAIQPMVREVLRRAKVDDLPEIFPTVDQAFSA